MICTSELVLMLVITVWIMALIDVTNGRDRVIVRIHLPQQKRPTKIQKYNLPKLPKLHDFNVINHYSLGHKYNVPYLKEDYYSYSGAYQAPKVPVAGYLEQEIVKNIQKVVYKKPTVNYHYPLTKTFIYNSVSAEDVNADVDKEDLPRFDKFKGNSVSIESDYKVNESPDESEGEIDEENTYEKLEVENAKRGRNEYPRIFNHRYGITAYTRLPLK